MPRSRTGKTIDGDRMVLETAGARPASDSFTGPVRADLVAAPGFRAALWQEVLDAHRSGVTASAASLCQF